MSMVFDALRQQGTQTTQEPTALGSVITPGGWRLQWGIAWVLLCLAVLLLAVYLGLDDKRVVPLAPPAEVAVPEVEAEQADLVTLSPVPLHVSRLPGDALARLAESAQASTAVRVKPPATLPARSAPVVVAAPAAVARMPVGQAETVLPEPAPPPVMVEVSPPAVDPAVLFAAFHAELAAERLPQAEAVIERARRTLGDSHLMVSRMQGYYCMRADCPERARQAYRAILSRLPRDHEAGYNLAVLDWQGGQHTEARKRVRTLLAQHPGDEALRALQRLMGASR
ncbi:tetratricopeptide repeat protein [Stutzerimonas stutzeri]|uniref:tetratricopeptide repeat protein n=1 Tax=Stutzerimonas stutzeri TaxID=316 RepID=UPI0015E3DBCD|nr:tetratricopeptide repeat protein [Stutzerimonas stutzeri]MBA1264285.1 tetratricopeptide repeat protein [Stutzerimonas stutzeri]